jgi:hypothetical protein
VVLPPLLAYGSRGRKSNCVSTGGNFPVDLMTGHWGRENITLPNKQSHNQKESGKHLGLENQEQKLRGRVESRRIEI